MASNYICKCKVCQIQDIDRTVMQEGVDYIHHGTTYYHLSCYKDWQSKKDKVDTNDVSEDLWKNATYDYLTRDIKIGIQNKFFNQWKQYTKSGKYTAKGIYFAIRFFYEVKHGDKEKADGGIGIIPYIYDDAKIYWTQLEHRNKGIIAEIESQMREAAERQKTIVRKKEVKPRKFTVDLSAIADMEDEE